MRVHSQKLLIAWLAVLLTACITDNIEGTGPDIPIGFVARVCEEPQTRGVVEGEVLKDGDFGVYGYNNGTLYGETGNKLDNMKVSHNGVLSSVVNWPGSQTLTFHAYYPHNGGSTTNINPTFTSAGGTIVFSSPPLADMDLMYAAGSGDRDDAHEGVRGKVKLEMKHLLSWLNIQAKKVDNTGTNATIMITGVTLTAQAGGTYTVTSADGAGSWTSRAARASRTTGTMSKTVETGATTVADFLIVPQNLQDAANSLVIDYTLNGSPKTLTVPAGDRPPMTEAGSQGMKHTLEVTFNINDDMVEVSFNTMNVLPWAKDFDHSTGLGNYILSVKRTVFSFDTSASSVCDATNLLQITTTAFKGWTAKFYTDENCTVEETAFSLVTQSGGSPVDSGDAGTIRTYIIRHEAGARTACLKIQAGDLSVLIKITQS